MVDYDALTQAGIETMLARGSYAEVSGLVAGPDEFPEAFREFSPQVIITNVQNHKGVDAVEITRLAKLANPNVPVIILTDDERDPFAIQAVQAGISAYILRKDVSTERLEGVIKTVLDTGSVVLNASLMRTVITSLTKSANTALSHSSGNEIEALSPRELEVLRMMSTGATNKEIGASLGITAETTRKHVAHIVEKLNARNRTHACLISNNASISGDG